MSSLPANIGNYRLSRVIGKGGMSQVWLAHHRVLKERQVAIKLLLSQDPEWIERFTREAEITIRLRHDHIISLLDHGYEHPYYYTVMEYVPGGALRGMLADRKPLALERAIEVFRDVAAALDYAHAQGVVHRDVSPGNILVDPRSSRVMLTDFGIAREASRAGVTTVDKIMGTPGYLSPEHAASATSVTYLSDIYGLGVVLFEMLTGSLPWDHLPGIADETGGVHVVPLTLRARGVTNLPPGVDRVIATMCALDPTKRYATAVGAYEELVRVLQHHTGVTTVIGAHGKPAARAELAEIPPAEAVLGTDMRKAPLLEARALADDLADATTLAGLLNAWSAESPFRRPLMGRLARVRRVISTNVYFYDLRVLLETRGAERLVEAPDKPPTQIRLERALDRWDVDLGAPAVFQDEAGGTVKLPGSIQVVGCPVCNEIGRLPCKRCGGGGRVSVTRQPQAATSAAPTLPAKTGAKPAASGAVTALQAATAIVACPDCRGTGGVACAPCAGVGQLVRHRTMTWSRAAQSYRAHDDLPKLDEQWLAKTCAAREVYLERSTGGLRPEWAQVPALATAIASAEGQLNNDTRIALAELTVRFIPLAEIVFDLGGAGIAAAPPPAMPPPAPKKTRGGKKTSAPVPPPMTPQPDAAGLFRWHIYGFERKLPNDWRFLNWDRVLLLVAVAIALAAILLFGLAVSRMMG